VNLKSLRFAVCVSPFGSQFLVRGSVRAHGSRFERFHQIAGEQAMPEGVTQRALGDLPGDRGRPVPGFARRGGDERAKTPAHLDYPFLQQRPVGVLDGVRVQFELGRKLPRRRQGLPRFQNPDAHRPVQFIRNLPVDGTRIVFPQLHEHGGILARQLCSGLVV
jgi:hypothetical protein